MLQENIDITHLSNYKTPAVARWYFELNHLEQVHELFDVVDFATQNHLPLLFVGGGTNMLFAFDVYQGVIIKNNLAGWNYDSNTHILETFSNENIWEIAEALETKHNQDIWHRFIGLPGSVGGAIFGNAGCFGLEVQHNFLDARVIDLQEKKEVILTQDDMQFEYRNSLLKKKQGRYFLVSARFDLSEKKEKYSSDVDNIYFREHKQPKGNSCGSFFKNPSRDMSAGYLIEQVGLKGYHHGGAYFSEKHANFLMHDGQGTYTDLLELIDITLQKVQDAYNIILENEVRIIRNP
ncbi:UDP-N-acetylmuramate dehydrogenase [Candidatus Gracilibacteria bacterium]|nr:UDP-N-acetylmuramate dehydrogenase [Candidatus Gracilibacteria bacterium]